MEKKELESILGELLSHRSFKKKAATWYRDTADALQLVDLQKSAYGAQFFINLCCVPSGMIVEGMPTPKEHKCPVRIRLTSAFPDRRNEIEEVFDLERNTLTDDQRAKKISVIVEELITLYIAYMEDSHSLRNAIQQGAFKRGMVSLAAKKHLGVEER